MMRSQQAFAFRAPGYLPPEHFDQIFPAHGTIMYFFAAMPLMIGLMDSVVPLQLGVRDVAFPTMNSTSLWLTVTGALLVNLSLVTGEFARTGWLPLPALAREGNWPALVSLLSVGAADLRRGHADDGHRLHRHDPEDTRARHGLHENDDVLLDGAGRQPADRRRLPDPYRHAGDADARPLSRLPFLHQYRRRQHDDVHQPDLGVGAPGGVHPGLPAFGIFSEIISTFSRKPLFNYRSMVIATLSICLISFCVWLHHFFTMGAGADVNAVFGISTSIIAVATGVKIFNWLFTMYGGRIYFATPMLWSLGFIVTFVVGGMTGVLLAVPPADFQLHNSLFLVAHFHNVIISGVLFAGFAGIVTGSRRRSRSGWTRRGARRRSG